MIYTSVTFKEHGATTTGQLKMTQSLFRRGFAYVESDGVQQWRSYVRLFSE